MKKSLKESLDNDAYLMRSLLTSSNKNSRRRLKSIEFGTIEMGKGCERYEECKKEKERQEDKSFDNSVVQYPTFGDWKVQLKVSCENSNQKTHSGSKHLQVSGTAEKKKNFKLNKLTEEYKIREIAETVKLRPRALRSIENIVTRKFVEKEEENDFEKMNKKGKRKLTEKVESSRCQALYSELQSNFNTIECNLKKVVNKKESFKILYLKQKEKYEEILRRHNIEEEVDDSELRKYFHS